MPFATTKLRMQQSGTSYAVATGTVKWIGTLATGYTVKDVSPTLVGPGALPPGKPFSVNNWRGTPTNRTADLHFATTITNVSNWHLDVFNPCRRVAVVMEKPGALDEILNIDLECLTHPKTQTLSALIFQVADHIGQAVLLIVRWPLQFLRKTPVYAAELPVEPTVDLESQPLKTTPPPGFEDDDVTTKPDDKRGAA